jgi:hypothetical protein
VAVALQGSPAPHPRRPASQLVNERKRKRRGPGSQRSQGRGVHSPSPDHGVPKNSLGCSGVSASSLSISRPDDPRARPNSPSIIITARRTSFQPTAHELAERLTRAENGTVATALLSDLVERGRDPEQGILFVLDGVKALRKAVRPVFGEVPVHRCIRHKERNVLDDPTERDRPAIKGAAASGVGRDRSRARAGAAARARRRARPQPSRRRRLAAGGDGGDAHANSEKPPHPGGLGRCPRVTESATSPPDAAAGFCPDVRRP